jgi:hypothetical protein
MVDNNNEDNRNLRSHGGGGGGGPEITLSTPILITEQKGGEEEHDNNSTGFAIDIVDDDVLDDTAIHMKIRQRFQRDMKELYQSGCRTGSLAIFVIWLWFEICVWLNPRRGPIYIAKKGYYKRKDTEKGSDSSN